MQLTYEEAKTTLFIKLALQGFAKAFGVSLRHVKPHGAMYNNALKNRELAGALTEAG